MTDTFQSLLIIQNDSLMCDFAALSEALHPKITYLIERRTLPFNFSFTPELNAYIALRYPILARLLALLKTTDPQGAFCRCGETICGFLLMITEMIAEAYRAFKKEFVEHRAILRCRDVLQKVFMPNRLARLRVPKRYENLPLGTMRERLIDRVEKMLRYVFDSFRTALQRLEPLIVRQARPINVGPYAQNFVLDVSIEKHYLVMQEGEHVTTFNFTSPKAWEIVRALLESTDSRGLTTLDRLFRGNLNTKDAQGNQVKDDLYRLSRHIHSAGDKSGRYFLSPNLRD